MSAARVQATRPGSGSHYSAPDADTQPRTPISALNTTPFLVNGQVPALGSFTFLCQSGCPTSTAVESLPAFSASLPWPNPSSGLFSLDVDASVIGHLEVIDALGRTVIRQSVPTRSGRTRMELDGTSLAPGIYRIRIRDLNGVLYRSIVIMR